MEKKRNGTTKILKIIGIVVTILLAVAAAAFGLMLDYGEQGHQVLDNEAEIAQMQPEVQKNTTHRVEDEIDTPYIKRDIAGIKQDVVEIKKMQHEILREVKK